MVIFEGQALLPSRLMMPSTAASTRRFIRPPTLSGVWEVRARG